METVLSVMSSVGSYHENSKPSAQKSSPLHDDNTTHTTNSYLEQDSYPSDFGLPTARRTNSQGVWLYSVNHPMESVHSALPDADGLRHMLLCRVILGKTEVVRPGYEQKIPSFEEFVSGVDNAVDPKKYIVWTPRMNTHILPEFLVSFRALSFKCRGFRIRQLSPNRLPYPILINILGKYLPFDAVELVTKHHDDFKNKKITRTELIEHTRHIVGDKLLLRIIDLYERKILLSQIQDVSVLFCPYHERNNHRK